VGRNVSVRIEGKTSVLNNLDKQLRRSGNRAHDATNAMARYARGEAKERTPVEDGDLRAGYVITSEMLKTKSKTVLANTVDYAARVHEQTEEKLRGLPRPGNRRGRFWDGGESKFLEKAAYNDKSTLLDVARDAAQIRTKR